MEIELSVVRHGWGPPAREWAGIDAFLTDIDCFQPEPEPELEPPADMLETTGSGDGGVAQLDDKPAAAVLDDGPAALPPLSPDDLAVGGPVTAGVAMIAADGARAGSAASSAPAAQTVDGVCSLEMLPPRPPGPGSAGRQTARTATGLPAVTPPLFDLDSAVQLFSPRSGERAQIDSPWSECGKALGRPPEDSMMLEALGPRQLWELAAKGDGAETCAGDECAGAPARLGSAAESFDVVDTVVEDRALAQAAMGKTARRTGSAQPAVAKDESDSAGRDDDRDDCVGLDDSVGRRVNLGGDSIGWSNSMATAPMQTGDSVGDSPAGTLKWSPSMATPVATPVRPGARSTGSRQSPGRVGAAVGLNRSDRELWPTGPAASVSRRRPAGRSPADHAAPTAIELGDWSPSLQTPARTVVGIRSARKAKRSPLHSTVPMMRPLNEKAEAAVLVPKPSASTLTPASILAGKVVTEPRAQPEHIAVPDMAPLVEEFTEDAQNKLRRSDLNVAASNDSRPPGFVGYRSGSGTVVVVSEAAARTAESWLREDTASADNAATGGSRVPTQHAISHELRFKRTDSLEVGKRNGFRSPVVSAPPGLHRPRSGAQQSSASVSVDDIPSPLGGADMFVPEVAPVIVSETPSSAGTSRPPGFEGFRTGRNTKIAISAEAKRNAERWLISEASEAAPVAVSEPPSPAGATRPPGFKGFRTGRNSKIAISAEAKRNAERWLISEASEAAPVAVSEPPSPAGATRPPGFKGFRTGRNSKIAISAEAKRNAERWLISEASEAAPVAVSEPPSPAGTARPPGFEGFRTGRNTKIAISAEAKRNAERWLISEASETAPVAVSEPPSPAGAARPPGFEGFRTGRNSKIAISAEAKRNAERWLILDTSEAASASWAPHPIERDSCAQIGETPSPAAAPAGFQGFRTGRNKSVQISADKLESAKKWLQTEQPRDAGQKIYEAEQPAETVMGPNDRDTAVAIRLRPAGFEGFRTGKSGSAVVVSTTAANKAGQLLHDAAHASTPGARRGSSTGGSETPGVCTAPAIESGRRGMVSLSKKSSSSLFETPTGRVSRLSRTPGSTPGRGGDPPRPGLFTPTFTPPIIQQRSAGPIRVGSAKSNLRRGRATPFRTPRQSQPSGSKGRYTGGSRGMALETSATAIVPGLQAAPNQPRKSCLREFALKVTAQTVLQTYTLEDLQSLNVTRDVSLVSASNASKFEFRVAPRAATNTRSISFDGVEVLVRSDGSAGCAEICRGFAKFLSTTGKTAVAVGWTENHYRWIVWKLAGIERRFPHSFGGNLLRCGTVVKQLRHRYRREIEAADRSCLKKILEKDEYPGRFLVLCVASVTVDQPPAQSAAGHLSTTRQEDKAFRSHILVTDGWYSIRAQLDQPLERMLRAGLIFSGLKLCIWGAELVSSAPVSPLDVPASVGLRLCYNGTRRARWDCRLGNQSRRVFPIRFGTIRPDGGQVGSTKFLVRRRYELIYWKRNASGRTQFVGARAERADLEAWNKEKQKISERVMAKLEKDWANHETEGRRHSRQTRNGKNRSRLTVSASADGKQVFEAVLYAENPDAVIADLSQSQLAAKDAYAQVRREERQRQIEQAINEKMVANGLISADRHEREVVPLLRLVVEEHPRSRVDANSLASAEISIWRPTSEQMDMMREGTVLRATGLLAKGTTRYRRRLALSFTKQTLFERINEAVPKQFCPRSAESFTSLALNRTTSAGRDVDIVGLVVQLRMPNNAQHRLYIANETGQVLRVDFESGSDQFWSSPVGIATGAVVGIKDLELCEHSGPGCSVVCRAHEQSVFTTTPRAKHLSAAASKLEAALKASASSVSALVAEIAARIDRISNGSAQDGGHRSQNLNGRRSTAPDPTLMDPGDLPDTAASLASRQNYKVPRASWKRAYILNCSGRVLRLPTAKSTEPDAVTRLDAFQFVAFTAEADGWMEKRDIYTKPHPAIPKAAEHRATFPCAPIESCPICKKLLPVDPSDRNEHVSDCLASTERQHSLRRSKRRKRSHNSADSMGAVIDVQTVSQDSEPVRAIRQTSLSSAHPTAVIATDQLSNPERTNMSSPPWSHMGIRSCGADATAVPSDLLALFNGLASAGYGVALQVRNASGHYRRVGCSIETLSVIIDGISSVHPRSLEWMNVLLATGSVLGINHRENLPNSGLAIIRAKALKDLGANSAGAAARLVLRHAMLVGTSNDTAEVCTAQLPSRSPGEPDGPCVPFSEREWDAVMWHLGLSLASYPLEVSMSPVGQGTQWYKLDQAAVLSPTTVLAQLLSGFTRSAQVPL